MQLLRGAGHYTQILENLHKMQELADQKSMTEADKDKMVELTIEEQIRQREQEIKELKEAKQREEKVLRDLESSLKKHGVSVQELVGLIEQRYQDIKVSRKRAAPAAQKRGRKPRKAKPCVQAH